MCCVAPQDSPRLSVALVHHANQFLITERYDNREGLGDVIAAYEKVLEAHRRYRVPVNINISGTLIEACAWYQPAFLERVGELREAGILTLIGGTYAENVMTLFPADYNIRQVNELFWLYERHFGCRPDEVKTCWIPERVWDTAILAPVLTSHRLDNGGFERVIVDDRVLLSTGGSYLGSDRAVFDSYGMHQEYYAGSFPDHAPYRKRGGTHGCVRPECYEGLSRIHPIEGGGGLFAVPISTDLRYSVPPSSPAQWEGLEKMRASCRDGALLVYADDFEKVAGTGPWDRSSPARYEDFLKWLTSHDDVTVVSLEKAGCVASESRRLETGAYYELSRAWGAGEDYGGWANAAAGRNCRAYLEAAAEEVAAAGEVGGDHRLLKLAWKHLLASGYETAWHDTTPGKRAVAPWARAVASHARASLVIACAARWAAGSETARLSVLVTDIDRDGEEEVVLRNDRVFAVISPRRGGRLTYLFARTERGGVLVIGNPSDDWNWQEELNRYMDSPANHPGGLADAGFEHEVYSVTSLSQESAAAGVRLSSIEQGSSLAGAEKTVLLAAGSPALFVSYRLPEGMTVSPVTCLSPDYYSLLRHGSGGVMPYDGAEWRGCRNGDTAAWVACSPSAEWVSPVPGAGHGYNVAVRSLGSTFDLLVGCGSTDARRLQRLFDRGRACLGHGVASPEGAGELA